MLSQFGRRLAWPLIASVGVKVSLKYVYSPNRQR